MSERAARPSVHIQPLKVWDFPDLLELWRARELVFLLISASFKARYRQSLLSVLWIVVQPLMSVGIFTVIFTGIAKVQTGSTPYPLYTLAGVITWNFFSRLLMDSSASLVIMSGVITKVYLPRLAIILVPVGPMLVEFTVGLLVLVGLYALFGYMPEWQIVLMPFFLLLTMMMSLAGAAWLAVTNVSYRDISSALPPLLQVVFYATPIVYPVEMIPERYQGVYWLNPMSSLIEAMRWCLLREVSFPPMVAFVYSIVVLVVILVPGLLVFNRFAKTAADRI